jgi:hypothetical protein
LVRNKIAVDPSRAEQDLTLQRIADAGSSEVDSTNPRRNVNPDLHVNRTGVVRTDCGFDVFPQPLRDGDVILEEEASTVSVDSLTTRPAIGILPEPFLDREFSVDPSDCEFSHNFDLGIGDVNRGGGPPLLVILRTVGIALASAFAAWRIQVVRKRGLKNVLPNPATGAKMASSYVEKRTGHKLHWHAKHLSPAVLGYRNVIIGGILFEIFLITGFAFDDSRGRISDAESIVLWVLGALFSLWWIYGLFIQSTAVQVRKGWMALARYCLSIFVGTLAFAGITWLVVSIFS